MLVKIEEKEQVEKIWKKLKQSWGKLKKVLKIGERKKFRKNWKGLKKVEKSWEQVFFKLRKGWQKIQEKLRTK